MNTSWLLLGGNLGNRLLKLEEARQQLSFISKIKEVSSIYETAPWGVEDQPLFLNQVLIIETNLQPYELLAEINQIEASLGRERFERWNARTIDIDILFYDNLIMNESKLTLPHPQLHHRKFTLVPCCELDSTFVHPVFNKTLENLLSSCKDELVVYQYPQLSSPKS